MLQKIRTFYYRIKKHITPLGIMAALLAAFSGQLFTAIVVGSLTYVFWRNEQGVDTLVGKVA